MTTPTHIVYRKLPDVPHRQYVRRIINQQLVLWHRDPHVAQRMSRNDAKTIAHILWLRSTGTKGMTITEPQGEYGTQEVTPGN